MRKPENAVERELLERSRRARPAPASHDASERVRLDLTVKHQAVVLKSDKIA